MRAKKYGFGPALIERVAKLRKVDPVDDEPPASAPASFSVPDSQEISPPLVPLSQLRYSPCTKRTQSFVFAKRSDLPAIGSDAVAKRDAEIARL